jgi:hypothetical protein
MQVENFRLAGRGGLPPGQRLVEKHVYNKYIEKYTLIMLTCLGIAGADIFIMLLIKNYCVFAAAFSTACTAGGPSAAAAT